ncbi:GNAT family N-acetyltransferase [Robiginitalea sp. SC105]|uniref:GNAT family N-acetyltransferase n=1 Tax=Robiginitalea sp. SC105 TaxID=2762332 RepID=UPI0016395F3B|nr:GNAT family N-acetyltransferase [Robiginitalea sp. SC105]MBC2838992.1 GNAT family N-acetyltransferase [Robiginitalea sp. SC105]
MISYRTATAGDNSQLLSLTRSSGMSGTIALRTDRDPDFFAIMKLRGESRVFVALDGEKLVGSICVSKEEVFVSGGNTPLFYITDFKVDPAYRNLGIGLELTWEVVRYLVARKADLALLHVAHGNKRPFVFFRDREKYPDFESIGLFRIYQFPAARKRLKKRPDIRVLKSGKMVLEFLNGHYGNRELARLIVPGDLEGVQTLAVFRNDQPVAMLCLQDINSIKRHVVLGMPWYLKATVAVLNVMRPITGTPRLPRVGEPIRMLHIKYLASPKADRNAVRNLIAFARREAYSKSCVFLSHGLHEKDPLIGCLPRRGNIVFKSTGMLVSMLRSHRKLERIRHGVPFKDFSTV